MKLHKDENIDFALSVGVVILIVPLVIFSGFTISTLWSWFVVPIFGLPSLTIPQALGLALVAGYMTETALDRKKRSESDPHENLVYMLSVFFRPAFFLLIGWVYTWFM